MTLGDRYSATTPLTLYPITVLREHLLRARHFHTQILFLTLNNPGGAGMPHFFPRKKPWESQAPCEFWGPGAFFHMKNYLKLYFLTVLIQT